MKRDKNARRRERRAKSEAKIIARAAASQLVSGEVPMP